MYEEHISDYLKLDPKMSNEDCAAGVADILVAQGYEQEENVDQLIHRLTKDIEYLRA